MICELWHFYLDSVNIFLVRWGEKRKPTNYFSSDVLTTLFILIITYVFHQLTLAMSTVFTSELYLFNMNINWNEQFTFSHFFLSFSFEIKDIPKSNYLQKPRALWTMIFFEYFFFKFIYVHHTLNWTPFLALLLVIYFTWFVT